MIAVFDNLTGAYLHKPKLMNTLQRPTSFYKTFWTYPPEVRTYVLTFEYFAQNKRGGGPGERTKLATGNNTGN